MAQKNPNSKGAGKLKVVTTSNFHMEIEISWERVFTHHITNSLTCIMAEIQKAEEQTFRTEAQSHIIEREFNHNVLLTTEGQRDRLSHIFSLFCSTWC